MKTRIYKKNQLKKNLELLKEAYYNIDDYKDEKYVDKMILGSRIVGIVLINNEVVGIGRIVGDGVRFSYITDLVVHKNHRGKGIGTKLVRALAKASNTTYVDLTTDPGCPWLKDFYEKAGFKLSVNEHVFYWDNEENK